MSSNVKTAVFWVVIICAVVLVYMAVKTGRGPTPTSLKAGDFIAYIQDGKIKDADITGTDVTGTYLDGGVSKQYHTVIPASYPKIYDLLSEKGVKYTIEKETGGGWIGILFQVVPILILLGLWIFMMRQMQSGGNKALSFGKSRARLHSSQQKKVTFKDVAGVEEAKEELQEIIEFLREPQKFQKLGGRIPKGVLLIGLPAPARRCWRARSRAKRMCRSFRFRVRTLWRCSWAWARAACATCSSKARRTRLASSSSMKSTPSDGIAAPVWAADTTSANRR